MTDDFSIRTFSPDDLTLMCEAFNKAFSDYEISFALSYDQFVNKFINKLGIDFSLSAGVFHDEKIIAFIFTGLGNYHGELVAYNGGTGVVPDFRGRRLVKEIYDFLIPIYNKQNVKKCVLEVLTSNKKAIKTYQSIGFTKANLLKCFKKYSLSGEGEINVNRFKVKELKAPDWATFIPFMDFSPSFLDSVEALERNIQNERTIVYADGEEIKGYAIYQPETGRISQLAVHKGFRRMGVGSALIAYLNQENLVLTAMNINSQAHHIIHFLNFINFKNEVDQYEMTMEIK